MAAVDAPQPDAGHKPADTPNQIQLAGQCYQNWIRGESVTDEQVEAAAVVTLEMGLALAHFGPSFRFAGNELVNFGHAMQGVQERRQQHRDAAQGATPGG